MQGKLTKFKGFHVSLCIATNSIKRQSLVYTQLNDQTVLFLIIQFSISHMFVFILNVKRFYFTHSYDPIRCYKRGPGSDSNEVYSAFHKVLALLEPHCQIVQFHIQDNRLWGTYSSAQKQLVHYKATKDWADSSSSFNLSNRCSTNNYSALKKNLPKLKQL